MDMILVFILIFGYMLMLTVFMILENYNAILEVYHINTIDFEPDGLIGIKYDETS